MAIQTFTKAGAKATTAAKLNKAIFDVDVTNHELLKLAYSAYLSNGRGNYAVTKTRGLVSGGGRKPWKQKGTGRARFGSSRVPIWRGGGVTFGPTGEENYTKSMPTVVKRKALRQALTMSATENRIRVIESLEVKDGKVATLAKLLSKIDINGRTLLVSDAKDESLMLASRNVPNLSVVSPKYLNVYSIMNADTLVVTTKSLDIINEWLGTSTSAATTGGEK